MQGWPHLLPQLCNGQCISGRVEAPDAVFELLASSSMLLTCCVMQHLVLLRMEST